VSILKFIKTRGKLEILRNIRGKVGEGRRGANQSAVYIMEENQKGV
jgi:hypothetical protein